MKLRGAMSFKFGLRFNLGLIFNGSDVERHSLPIWVSNGEEDPDHLGWVVHTLGTQRQENKKRLYKGTNYTHFENLVAKSAHLKYQEL